MSFTYYQILGVGEQATREEIKKAYKALALKYHPDRTGGNRALEEHYKKITEAYTVLSNPEKRKQYDLKRNALLRKKQEPSVQHAKPFRASTPTPPPAQKTTQKTTQAKQNAGHASRAGHSKKSKTPMRFYLYGAGILALFAATGIVVYVMMNSYSAELRLKEARYEIFRGNSIQALLLYTEALSFAPKSSTVYFERGVLRRKAFRDPQAARFDLLNAIRYADTPQAAHSYELALCLLAEKQPAEAVQWLRKAIELNPNSDSMYYALGEAYAFYQDVYDSAVTAFDSVLVYNPSHTDAMLGKGYSLLKLNRVADALSCFTAIIALDDTFIDAYMLRAEAYMRINQTEKACIDWKKALDLGEKDAETGLKNYCTSS